MAALSFLSNIKVNAPLPTDWKYRVEKRSELVSILAQPTNYPYQGQLAVVVNDTINDGLYLLQTLPDLNQANSGLSIDNWIKLEIKTYIGTSSDVKPALGTYQAGVLFYETDTAFLSMWDGTQWVTLISGPSDSNFVEFDKFTDLPSTGESLKLYVVLHDVAGNDLNHMYRWDATHDNGDGTTGRYELMGGSSGGGGGGETVNPITSRLPDNVGGIEPGQTVPSGTDLEEFIVLLLDPLVLPTKVGNYVSMGVIPTSLREIGTAVNATLTHTYNAGIIHSKNGASDIALTGAEVSHVFSGAGVDPTTGIISSDIIKGNNTWGVSVDYIQGIGDYYDSTGAVSCIFNTAADACPGDGSRGAGTVTGTSNSLIGIYPYFYGVDVADISDGDGIYGLTKRIETKSNKTYSIFNADGSSAKFIYFAFPKTYGNLTTILDGNGFNITTSFTKFVNDVTSVIPGGTNWTHSYNIYKSNSRTFVDPAQNYQFKF